MQIQKYTIALFLIGLCFSIQGQSWWKSVRAEGPVIERDLPVRDFTSLSVAVPAKVFVEKGSTYKVRAVGQANVLDLLNDEVSGNGRWTIKFDQSVRRLQKLEIYITMPSLEGLSVSGSGSVKCTGKFPEVERFDLSVSGSGNLSVEIAARHTEMRISGSGNMQVGGMTDTQDINISGSGRIDAYDMRANRSEVRISGSGSAKVHVMDALEGRISGSGNIYYHGQPKVRTRISGSGNLIAKD